ncbi:MAG: hypothetical protein ACJZ8W_12360 [Limisphaerales bacterium]
MSNKNFGKRKKSQSFRPSGGMRNKVLKKESEQGREDMENGRILDEPVFDHTHEAEILKAENKAFGVKEEVEKPAQKNHDDAPKKKEQEETGIIASVKRFVRKLIPKKPSGREIIISAESLETRIGIMKSNRLEDFTMERNNDERIVASIYKGKVRNLEDRLEAAFVDIGIEKKRLPPLLGHPARQP